ncbi:NB-ARC domain disease resistance protein [Medicago truncatula]|uniref:NB-ARC domain disease resistance protein n=1 Tax=Medicago truncatula TaxID=3880 RepID=G7KUR0_MEDTR|nr:NB-ARC domain disease resistance protein [Medicago truncatula]
MGGLPPPKNHTLLHKHCLYLEVYSAAQDCPWLEVGNVEDGKSEEKEWMDVLQGDFWKLCEDEDSIMPVLKLSYQSLSPQMRQCFAYCLITRLARQNDEIQRKKKERVKKRKRRLKS